jgi:hypothetical protein
VYRVQHNLCFFLLSITKVIRKYCFLNRELEECEFEWLIPKDTLVRLKFSFFF